MIVDRVTYRASQSNYVFAAFSPESIVASAVAMASQTAHSEVKEEDKLSDKGHFTCLLLSFMRI